MKSLRALCAVMFVSCFALTGCPTDEPSPPTNSNNTSDTTSNNTSSTTVNNTTANNTTVNNTSTSDCGDGALQPSEKCDPMIPAGSIGACPTACPMADACTPSVFMGDAMSCTAECVSNPITACMSGDGCCPMGCEFAMDNDCPPPMDDCGDGALQPGEKCDPMIPAGNVGACPTMCEQPNSCTAATLMGDASMCSAECVTAPINTCMNGDGCCPNGCMPDMDDDCMNVELCGNGMVDQGETCDKAIAAGQPGACPVSCDDSVVCTADMLVGDVDSCTAECQNDEITTPANDDQCCPAGADANNDNDCPDSTLCGNGVVDGNEACDNAIAAGMPGACPTSCDDSDACTNDTLNGMASDCTAECANPQVTMCMDGDMCCAPGCTNDNDDDCRPTNTCGNGTLDPNEECDNAIAAGMPGACPTQCAPTNTCETAQFAGMDSDCTRTCERNPITACVNGDGCCAPGCTNAMDNDCAPPNLCGNGVIDGAEACDRAIAAGMPGACPTAPSCNDMDACTTDSLVGDAMSCTAACQNNPITMCVDGDGCCPNGCSNATDNDCAATTQPVGSACTSNAECDSLPSETAICGDGEAYTAGYCTSTCVGNADCPGSNVCLDGFCFDACSSTGQCRTADNYSCFALGGAGTPLVCGPGEFDPAFGADTGGSCTDSGECKSAANQNKFCQTEWPGGYCASTCTADTDCQGGGRCQGGFCMDSCTANLDCRGGTDYRCLDYFGDGQRVCVPNNPTPFGAACTMNSDCTPSLVGAALCLLAEDDFPGGYCTSGCLGDEQCPAGTFCRIEPNAPDGLCVPTCGTNADCQVGGRSTTYECYDSVGGTQDHCWPTASGAGLPGDACANRQACAGGQEGFCIDPPVWSDGYCTQVCQVTCPTGSHCAGIFGGACVSDCTATSDCRPGYTCRDIDTDQVNECLPSATGAGAVGDACTQLADCSGDADGACITEDATTGEFAGGYCTLFCDVNACPAGAVCAEDGGMNRLCLDTCTTAADCRTGYSCSQITDTAGTVVDACLPIAPASP